nr:hypothetical protein [Brevibacterium sp. UCMA 11754]
MSIAGKASGGTKQTDTAPARRMVKRNTGLHHDVVVGHRPVSDLRASVAVLRGWLAEQVVEILVRHDGLIASGWAPWLIARFIMGLLTVEILSI